MAVAAAPTGLVLGRYRPLQPLGSGGSGSVWLARDESAGVEVALKIVPREGNAASRAEREATAAARLRHQHCLRSYALARDSRHVYIAYEYVPGRTLREALRAGEVSDRAAVEAAAQVLDVLACAHEHGIVHRDVKPSNVLLADGSDVSVRLLDFGLARMDGADTLTAAGDVPGTLAYISPERLHGEEAEAPADVWAVGVLLWEALSGWHPFWKGSLVETARRIEAGAASLAKPRPDLPKPLIALVDRALALDPAKRPSAASFAAGLRVAFQEREVASRSVSFDRRAVAARAAPAAAAAVFAGWTAAAVPFYPSAWAYALAAVAACLALVHGRAGLLFALAVPVFPLGNASAGLAWTYAVVAAAWATLSWRRPRDGLFLVAGPLLAPLGALPLLPLAAQTVRGRARRAVQVPAAVVLATIVARIRDVPLDAEPGIAQSGHPVVVATTLVRALASEHALVLEAAGLAAAAIALPFARRSSWTIAGFGAALLAVALLPTGSGSAAALVACVWATCVALALQSRR